MDTQHLQEAYKSLRIDVGIIALVNGHRGDGIAARGGAYNLVCRSTSGERRNTVTTSNDYWPPASAASKDFGQCQSVPSFIRSHTYFIVVGSVSRSVSVRISL